MITKTINKEKLKEAIRIAFKDDTKIKEFYDENAKVETLDDIVNDIYRKISVFDDSSLCGVYEKNELIGYFVHVPKMLVSFSINNKYRVRNKLREFFSLIRDNIGSKWGCILWSKNIRGIKWLLKNGLKVIERNDLITVLHFGT